MTVPTAAVVIFVTMRALAVMAVISRMAVMAVIYSMAVTVAADCQQTDRRGIEWIAAEGESPHQVRFIYFLNLFSSIGGHPLCFRIVLAAMHYIF